MVDVEKSYLLVVPGSSLTGQILVFTPQSIDDIISLLELGLESEDLCRVTSALTLTGIKLRLNVLHLRLPLSDLPIESLLLLF